MPRRAWLTPAQTPTAEQCAVITLPDDGDYRAAFRGALLLLADENNWETYGAVTPAEAASVFLLALIALDATWGDCP